MSKSKKTPDRFLDMTGDTYIDKEIIGGTQPITVPVYAETPDELEARIAKLESRVDWLYRWTLSDRNGHKYYSPAFTERAKDDRFPLPDYDAPGGPRKPQGEP